MINWLHNFLPRPVLLELGFIHIYWYGLFVVLAIMVALVIAQTLAKKYDFSKAKLFDLAFWLIIFGIIGARLYHIGLEYHYYLTNPIAMFKIWQGGLAIHGGVLAGIIVVWYFTRQYKYNFWLVTSLIVPGLALAQAIGRWGNYFNQELFGLPTALPWGIPIATFNRLIPYLSENYFHPTFLYESLGSLCLTVILLALHYFYKTKNEFKYLLITLSYLIGYSILRFSLEFIRLDLTPLVAGLRWPQWMSLLITVASFVYLVYYKLIQNKKTKSI